jgi:hypothetical protein
MTKSFAAALTALTFGLSLPAWAGDAYRSDKSADKSAQSQTAQAQPEQQRLPAAKDGTSSNAGQAQGATSSDPSAISETTTEKDKGQVDQEKAKKHPPTAVMDKATPPEKATSETGAPPKHPPTSVMERATPEQKSPQGSAEVPK